MQFRRIEISEFLGYRALVPVIDARSPSEYKAGHIPGSVNIPVFTDEERAVVGTTYKKKGRIEAVRAGLQLAGPKLAGKFLEASDLSAGGRLLIYCWRGGMRSESLAWMMSLSGMKTFVLQGGYQAYRRYILDRLASKSQIMILGGLTGSGKTAVLKILRDRGEQVVDLEELAAHRGSAFGALGYGPQPSTEQFANNLFEVWRRFDADRSIWLEDESRNIGNVFLPERFWRNMQEAPVIALISSPETRLPRLLEEYSSYPEEMLVESVMKISKRLGGERTREAVECIRNGRLERAAGIILSYYDKAYMYSIDKRPSYMIHKIFTASTDAAINAEKILEYAYGHDLLSSV